MANQLYPLARQAWADANISWSADDIKVALVGAGYSYNAANEFRSQLTDVAADSANLASKTNVGGVLDAADIAISGVSLGEDVTGVVVYADTGTPATSRLLAYFDTKASGELIELDGDGGVVTVRWSNAVNKILKL